MRILVTVKHVPDLQSQRSFTEGRVTRNGDDGTMNELDENAVEAALQARRGGRRRRGVRPHGGRPRCRRRGPQGAPVGRPPRDPRL
ncbi:hypothetical protein [Demequina litorisediminis]|uniref:hypothetical protein n=1 Tax=Demequina litorisediminis TaxID=1849022 RepID=UPI0024E0DEDB|nr:hypothetical protein [Demequina litorisediminis]